VLRPQRRYGALAEPAGKWTKSCPPFSDARKAAFQSVRWICIADVECGIAYDELDLVAEVQVALNYLKVGPEMSEPIRESNKRDDAHPYSAPASVDRAVPQPISWAVNGAGP